MTGAGFTPGPWRIAPYGRGGREASVQIVNDNSQVCGPANVADARLIAAAPELYRVCEMITKGASSNQIREPLFAALRKARGETPNDGSIPSGGL